MLLEKGADYNKCDNLCMSPVMKATMHGHIDIVQILLRAYWNRCDFDNFSCVMTALDVYNTSSCILREISDLFRL